MSSKSKPKSQSKKSKVESGRASPKDQCLNVQGMHPADKKFLRDFSKTAKLDGKPVNKMSGLIRGIVASLRTKKAFPKLG